MGKMTLTLSATLLLLINFNLFGYFVDTTKSKKPLPLEAGRSIQLDTDQGTWLSLDVSPDGQTIVFDFLGDLYTIPITGGDATQITSGMAYDVLPRYSPDGKSILFISDRSGGDNVWIINTETQDTVQVTTGNNHRYQSPEWSPDGEYVFASRVEGRRGAHKIWMFHREGGSGVQLAKSSKKPDPNSNVKMVETAFGPDPRYLWFSKRTGDWQYNAVFPQYQLAVFDRETGKIETKTDRYGSAFRPTLSPDGKYLVYGTRHDQHTGLRVRELDSGEERWLAYPVQHDDQESRATLDVLPGMSFTPDSKFLIASYGGKIWSLPIEGGEATNIPFRVRAQLQLGPLVEFEYPISDSDQFVARQIRDAVLSPDGAMLAFTVLDRLYVMDIPDGEAERVTNLNITEAQPSWSPDGAHLVFTTWSEQDQGHLYQANVAGRLRLTQLTNEPGLYQGPVYSPDGGRIVFNRASAQSYQDAADPYGLKADSFIGWIPADGGSVNKIAPSLGRFKPHFVLGEDRIYLHSNSQGLVSIRFDGTDEKQHLKVTGIKVPGTNKPIEASLILRSPQKDHALAQVNNDLYLVKVPYVGGVVPTVSVAKSKGAPFPFIKLTDIGGQFPTWSSDGNRLHWSIGNSFFTYDIEAENSLTDSIRAIKRGLTEDDTLQLKQIDTLQYRPLETPVLVELNRDIPEGNLLLQGARLITMNDYEIIENGDIYIENNRIRSIGASGTLDTPADVTIVDVSGKTIIPGLVDTHAHLRPYRGIHRKHIWSYLANLAYGVTTTRDPQTGTTDVLTYGDQVRAGHIIGPRIYSTGPGVFYAEQIKNQEHARNVLKRYSKYYDTKTLKMYVSGNRQQRQWIIKAAREQQLMPTTEGALNFKLNMTQVIDGYPGHEHSFPIFPIYRDVVQLVAESRTVYTPTLLVAYGGPWAENYFYATENVHDDIKLQYWTPHHHLDSKTRRRGSTRGGSGWFMPEEHVFEEHGVFLKDLIASGGRAGVGSHGQLQGLGYHWELWAMQAGGLSEHDALRVATVIGAEGIGLGKDLGSLEPGKLADLVILNQNPLQNIRSTNTVSQVMLNGRLYDANTLDQIAPEQVQMDQLWWQQSEPANLPGVGN